MKISQTCEVWAVIDGFTRYEVSTRGRVRVRATGHILSPDINNTGYPTVRLLADGTNKKTHLNIHRIEAFAFLPNISECVNHIDGNKENNHISNLEWCTYSRNNQHAYDMGLKHARGLTSEEAKRMRANVDISFKYSPVIDLTTGKRYKSMEATKEDGFSPNKVQAVCSGKHKTHLGHVFVYDRKEVSA